ncbi:MAG: hypothetical protein J1F39_01475 [Clostridiales bacterium]|nr:hypothetical protein [Clostridiales bacterium]
MPDIPEELLRRVEANEPAALWEYSRILEETDIDEAYKYAVLAAQLFHPQAIMLLGDRCAKDNDSEEAERYYRMGVKAGLVDCSVKLAKLHLLSNEPQGLIELEELTEMGVKSAAAALAEYYKARGNEKQYEYWSSRVSNE